MDKSIEIIENYLEESLWNDCLTLSNTLFYSAQTIAPLKTNYSWDNNLVKDSNPIIIYTIDDKFVIFDKIKNYIKDKNNIDVKYILLTNFMQNSHIPWHNDGIHNGGMTIYLNTEWNKDHGGIFLFEHNDEIKGIYPSKNLAVIQRGGVNHCVAPTTRNSEIRKTIQIFF